MRRLFLLERDAREPDDRNGSSRLRISLDSYGQTASGKTHTMMGTDDEPGVIPLAISELFDYIHTVRVVLPQSSHQ